MFVSKKVLKLIFFFFLFTKNVQPNVCDVKSTRYACESKMGSSLWLLFWVDDDMEEREITEERATRGARELCETPLRMERLRRCHCYLGDTRLNGTSISLWESAPFSHRTREILHHTLHPPPPPTHTLMLLDLDTASPTTSQESRPSLDLAKSRTSLKTAE